MILEDGLESLLRDVVRQAVLAEREACAKMAEAECKARCPEAGGGIFIHRVGCDLGDLAAAIRARA